MPCDDDALVHAIRKLRLEEPALGVKAMTKRMQESEADVTTKDVRTVVKALEAEAAEAVAESESLQAETTEIAPRKPSTVTEDARLDAYEAIIVQATGLRALDFIQSPPEKLALLLREHLKIPQVVCLSLCSLTTQMKNSTNIVVNPKHPREEILLAKMDEAKSIKSRIIRTGCLPDVFRAMRAHWTLQLDRECVLNHSLRMLADLSESTFKHKMALVDAGLIPVVADVMRIGPHGSDARNGTQFRHDAQCGCQNCYETQQNGCVILCNVGCTPGECEQAVRDAGGIDVLKAATQRLDPRDDVRRHVLTVLTTALVDYGCDDAAYKASLQRVIDSARVDNALLRPEEGFDNLGKSCALCGAFPPGWPPAPVSMGETGEIYHDPLPPELPDSDHSRSFMKCSRCRRVRYCSVECQRAAWRSGHKRTCGRPLPSSVDVPTDLAELTLALREFGRAHAGLAVVYASALLRSVQSQQDADETVVGPANDALEAAAKTFGVVAKHLASLGWKEAAV